MTHRIAWVTGAGTGIGKALAAQLSRAGYWVVISGRRADILRQTAQELTTPRPMGDVWAIPGDAADSAYAARVRDTVHEKWGDIDLLINNAGENTYKSFQQAAPEDYEHSFRTNCLSAILCAQAVLPAMLARRSGTIVNVSSILGRMASGSSSTYSVSKYAMAGFTDSLRQELIDSGVHVIGVYPGFIRTAMTLPRLSADSPKRKYGKSPEAMAAAILKGIRRGKREVLFPWYVPWVLRMNLFAPGILERLRTMFER